MKPSRRRPALVAAAVVLVLAISAAAWRGRPASAAPDRAAPARPATSVVEVSPTVERWPQTLLATGAVAAWQEAVIAAEYGGLRIAELHADVGSRVRRGDVLAVLSDDTTRAEVQKQEATVAQARASLAKAKSDVERAHGVEGSGALSNQKVDEYRATQATSQATLDAAEADLRTARIHLAQTRVVAVDDGIVSSRSAVLGNVVATGTELFRLVRQGRVDWQAELDARQLGQVAVGQAAHVVLPDGTVANGRIRLLAPTISTTTGRAIVYAALDADSGARPGLYASGQIDGPQTPATTLPQSAVLLRDGRSDVYVVVPPAGDAASQPIASRRTVVTGRRRGDRVEIVSGLPADARVVERGGAFLSEGMPVQAVQAAAVAASSAGKATP